MKVKSNIILIEAESFSDLGGWVVDQQFMDIMGSPFLMAHGMGVPVENARTEVCIDAPGTYIVKVRTRDWVAPYGPGTFRISINGTYLEKTFGNQGDGRWEWVDGGSVDLSAGKTVLELEDLTGFNGRCDAILLIPEHDKNVRIPDCGDELALFGRKVLGLPAVPPDAGNYDFVVAGGGYAGICAAVAAARLGLKTALIHDRPVLGGNASGEVRVAPIGKIDTELYPRNADIIKELLDTPEKGNCSGGIRPNPDDEYVEGIVAREKHLDYFPEMHVFNAEVQDGSIKAVRAEHIRTGMELRFPSQLFCDCTGDGRVGYLSGADWRLGREGKDESGESFAPPEGDTMLLGLSNYWTAKRGENSTEFVSCPWALQIESIEMMEVSKPRWPAEFDDYAYAAGWNWETGFDKDQIHDAEHVRDHNFRALFGAWDFMKNKSPQKKQFETAYLDWVGYIMGKRESRRLMGDVILSEHDFRNRGDYNDGCVCATWYFDFHFPHPLNTKHFPGEEFRSFAYDDPQFEKYRGDIKGEYTTIEPYPIPYRCLYSRNIENLFMAGRNISVTHAGLMPVRVMNTTGMMGTVAGRAAALCCRIDCSPRELYSEHLEELKKMLRNPV